MQAHRHIAVTPVCLHCSHAAQPFSGKQARQTRVHTFPCNCRSCCVGRAYVPVSLRLPLLQLI